MEGWGRIKSIAEYIDGKPRKVSELIKQGLPFAKIPGGSILIKFSDVDEFLKKHEVKENKVDKIVDDVMGDLK